MLTDMTLCNIRQTLYLSSICIFLLLIITQKYGLYVLVYFSTAAPLTSMSKGVSLWFGAALLFPMTEES